MLRRLALLLALGAPLLWAAPSAASPAFPGVIQQHYGTSCTVDCSFCHVGTPGLGTANTQLATTLKARGLTAANTSSLDNALTAIDNEPQQQALVTALKACVNPNADAPVYGCGVAPHSTPLDPMALLLAAAIALGLPLARRRARRQR